MEYGDLLKQYTSVVLEKSINLFNRDANCVILLMKSFDH